jgi:hypothetical protein
MFDEVEGLWFLPEYRLVHEVFADPALITGRRYQEAVSWYLKGQGIPPIVLRRLAEQVIAEVCAQHSRKKSFLSGFDEVVTGTARPRSRPSRPGEESMVPIR